VICSHESLGRRAVIRNGRLGQAFGKSNFGGSLEAHSIDARGPDLVYRPAYSTGLNPIEQCFSRQDRPQGCTWDC
jgi:hypothetical protein